MHSKPSSFPGQASFQAPDLTLTLTTQLCPLPHCPTAAAAAVQFGVPKYGGTLLGRVLYPKDDDPLACKSPMAPLPQGVDMPIIMLVDRGGEGWNCAWALPAAAALNALSALPACLPAL